MNATTNNLDQLRAKATNTIGEVKNDLSAAAQQMRETASDASDAIKTDMHQLIESAKSSGKAELAAAAERLSSYVTAMADSAITLQQKGRDAAKQVADTTDTYVHDKPWQSVAIGAGVGAAIGLTIGWLAARR